MAHHVGVGAGRNRGIDPSHSKSEGIIALHFRLKCVQNYSAPLFQVELEKDVWE